MKNIFICKILPTCLFIFTLFFSTLAYSDVFLYSINSPNAELSPYTGPYATLSINLVNSTSATLTFTSSNNGGYTYLMGATGAADVNVNAASWTVTALTNSNSFSGFTPGSLSDNGSQNISQFGTLNQTIKSSDGFTSASTAISFTLTNTSGIWNSASNVLTANSKGYLAAIHAFACANTCNVIEGATVSGFAGNSIPVPEPATYLLLASFFGVILFISSNNKAKITN